MEVLETSHSWCHFPVHKLPMVLHMFQTLRFSVADLPTQASLLLHELSFPFRLVSSLPPEDSFHFSKLRYNFF